MIININEHPELIFGAVPDGNPLHAFMRTGMSSFPESDKNTGVRIRLKTRSRFLKFQYKYKYVPIPANMGQVMVNGLCYSIRNESGEILVLDLVVDRGNAFVPICKNNSEHKMLLYEFHCPALNSLNDINIEVEDNDVEPYTGFAYSSPILFLGASISFGCGATFTRATMADIIAHKLNSDYYNISVQNNMSLDASVVETAANAIKEPWLVVVELNTRGVDYSYCQTNLMKYLETVFDLFKNSGIIFSDPFLGNLGDDFAKKHELCKAAVKELAKSTLRQVSYIDGTGFFGDLPKECVSLSSYRVNDYAHLLYGERIAETAAAYSYIDD